MQDDGQQWWGLSSRYTRLPATTAMWVTVCIQPQKRGDNRICTFLCSTPIYVCSVLRRYWVFGNPTAVCSWARLIHRGISRHQLMVSQHLRFALFKFLHILLYRADARKAILNIITLHKVLCLSSNKCQKSAYPLFLLCRISLKYQFTLAV